MKDKIIEKLIQFFCMFSYCSTFYCIYSLLNFFEILEFFGIFEGLLLPLLFLLVGFGFWQMSEYITTEKNIKIKEQNEDIKRLWSFLTEEQKIQYNIEIKKENKGKII